MTLGNGRVEMQAIPLLALLPKGARNPRFYVAAQYETLAGVLLPKRDIQVQGLPPDIIIQLFVNLVNQGLIHQIVTDEQGQEHRASLPAARLAFGRLIPLKADAIPSEPNTPKSPIILEGGWGCESPP